MLLSSSSSSSLVTTELFQRVRGSRPEILDQKRSPDSSVRGKNITLLPSISSSPEESFVLFCFVVGIDNRLSSPANSLLRYIALHRRDLHSLTRRHLSKVCRKRQVHAFLPVEESRTEYSGKNSFSLSSLLRAMQWCIQRFWRSLRLPEGRHGQNVRHEMPGQETHQNETGRNAGSQRAHHALFGQHRRKWISSFILSPRCPFFFSSS